LWLGFAFIGLVFVAPAVPYLLSALTAGGVAVLQEHLLVDGVNIYSPLPFLLAIPVVIVGLLFRRPGAPIGVMAASAVLLMVWFVGAFFLPYPPWWTFNPSGGPGVFR
jgi:hypothetical protein